MVLPSLTMTLVVISWVVSSGMETMPPCPLPASRMVALATLGLSSMRISPVLETKGRKKRVVPVSRN